MITARIDRPKLERSLKRFAADFGDTNAQAICRWGVQTCRELAGETIPWKSRGSERKQHQIAIERDMGRVVFVDNNRGNTRRRLNGERVLRDASSVIAWMDENRQKNRRTRKLPPEKRKFCSERTFRSTVRLLMKNAGIAKGGFIGAGQDIARAQKGTERISIGKNFLSYAQKHSSFGDAVKPTAGFKPFALLINKATHTSSDYVIKKSAMNRAMDWGLKKTLTWYRKAMKRVDRKAP